MPVLLVQLHVLKVGMDQACPSPHLQQCEACHPCQVKHVLLVRLVDAQSQGAQATPHGSAASRQAEGGGVREAGLHL